MEAKTLVMRAVDEYSIRLKPKLDQYFLIDDNVISDLISVADIKPGMNIIEIGVGAGQITRELLRRGCVVYGYEIDERFEPLLREIDNTNFHLTIGDAFEHIWPLCDQIISNLPFTLTETLAHKLHETNIHQTALILGNRTVDLFKRHETVSKLKLMFESMFEISIHSEIPPSAFFPQPPYNTAIVTMKRREQFEGGPRMRFWQTFFSRPNTSVFSAIQVSLPKLKRRKYLSIYDFHLPKNVLSMRAGNLSNQHIVSIDEALMKALGRKNSREEDEEEMY